MFLRVALQNYFKQHLSQKLVMNILLSALILPLKEPLSILCKDHSVVSGQGFNDYFLVYTFSLVRKLVKKSKELIAFDIYKLDGP